MTDIKEKDQNEAPSEIDFRQYIKYSQRSSSEIERQVTICRYRTNLEFDYRKIAAAVKRCQLKPRDELGVIDWYTSEDLSLEQQESDDSADNDEEQLDVGPEWIRALFGLISENYFRWLDRESRDIYEFMIEGVLGGTFLTEYYQNADGDLEFLTYGGSQYEQRVKTKHRQCFLRSLRAQLVEFPFDFVRKIFIKPKFRSSLKEIVYVPSGEAGYGTVDESSMRSKYENIIDPTAERVDEIISNPRILIKEFMAKVTIQHPSVYDFINIRFRFTKRGRITLYLPQIEFARPLNEVQRENKMYEIVRNAYGSIIGSTSLQATATDSSRIPRQLTMDALVGDW